MASFRTLDNVLIDSLDDLNVQASTIRALLSGMKNGLTSCELSIEIIDVALIPVFQAWVEAYLPMSGDRPDTRRLAWTEVPGTRVSINEPVAGETFGAVSHQMFANIEDLRIAGSSTLLDVTNNVDMDAVIKVN